MSLTYAGLLAVAVVLGVIILSLLLLVIKRLSWSKTRWILIVSAFGVAIISVFIWHISKPRIVAAATAPDRTELRVVQTCNWDPEGFTTAVYYLRPGKTWGWFDHDHQDDYWGHGKAEVDMASKRIKIFRGKHLTATFEWETERFWLLREGMRQPIISSGAQAWASPPS